MTIRERFDELSQIIRDFDGFKGLDHGDFSQMLATTYQVLNQIHPWREGNGRAQRVFLDDLAREAGYQIDWASVHGQENVRVSEAARMGDQVPMTEMMHRIVGPRPEPTREPAAPAGDLHQPAFPHPPVIEPQPVDLRLIITAPRWLTAVTTSGAEPDPRCSWWFVARFRGRRS